MAQGFLRMGPAELEGRRSKYSPETRSKHSICITLSGILQCIRSTCTKMGSLQLESAGVQPTGFSKGAFQDSLLTARTRSAARRVGTESVSTCRSRVVPSHYTKHINKHRNDYYR